MEDIFGTVWFAHGNVELQFFVSQLVVDLTIVIASPVSSYFTHVK